MESNSYLIEPNSQYRQELRLIMSEEEIRDLWQALANMDDWGIPQTKVVMDLRAELWYMLLEIHEFNEYHKQGGKP